MEELGKIIKHQRMSMSMTLQELADRSGVSPSHVARIEMGQRFPSARILKKMAEPLGFDVNELFTLAGYLPPQSGVAEEVAPYGGGLDPYVARTLAKEPVEIQRTLIVILDTLKNIARGMTRGNGAKV